MALPAHGQCAALDTECRSLAGQDDQDGPKHSDHVGEIVVYDNSTNVLILPVGARGSYVLFYSILVPYVVCIYPGSSIKLDTTRVSRRRSENDIIQPILKRQLLKKYYYYYSINIINP